CRRAVSRVGMSITNYQLPITNYQLPFSPVFVLGAVERRALRLRVDIEDVAPAPARGIRFIGVGPEPPVLRVRHRIDRDAPEKLQLPARRVVVRRDALDEHLEAWRIVLASRPQLRRRDVAEVRLVLEL